MKRIEFFMSQSVEEDFLALIEKLHFVTRKDIRYTKIPAIMGRGCSNPKMGDAIWPQLNCAYIVYCDDDDAPRFAEIVRNVRGMYPSEGIAAFVSDAESLA